MGRGQGLRGARQDTAAPAPPAARHSVPSCPEVMLSGQRTCSVCLVLGLQRPWGLPVTASSPTLCSCWQSAWRMWWWLCGVSWALCGFCVPVCLQASLEGSAMSCVPCCWPGLPLLGNVWQGVHPHLGKGPRRWGLPAQPQGACPDTRKGGLDALPVSPPPPCSGRCCAEPGYGPVSPGPGGRGAPLWQALRLGADLSMPQPTWGCVQELAPGSLLWVLQAMGMQLWVLRCTYRGSDVTPEVPFPGGGLASGMGVGVRPLCVAVHFPPSAEASEGAGVPVCPSARLSAPLAAPASHGHFSV